MKHDLARRPDGEIDGMAFDIEDQDGRGHNGPWCRRCGEGWCTWCEQPDTPWLDDECEG